MTENWLLRAEAICMACGGHCCDEAHPPITRDRYQSLIAAGIPDTCFEHEGYLRLRARPDGTCILMKEQKCTCHAVKPETCRAGPFTFDVEGERIRIFLKHASICPLVPLLKEEPAAFRLQYERAAENIVHLVTGLSGTEIEAINRIEEPETELVAELPWGQRFL
ncbi:YkgJ family cysteine cluster protein [Methanoregula sp.]|uniref:YkgJ family cysteine cluster protein n=1 Tax=Methanoregula sp. TaxID=2052170 RepID=UPI002C3D5680|nr:YkgJ family cysteine cluster protein [Methanoregula sp.]HVP95535.1 YkgJ family cysteine cluster protein [Methanoregula sp.]